MDQYYYIDEQGNISDALPLAALHKIGLPPTTKVLLGGGKQWTTLAQVSQQSQIVAPPPPTVPAPPPPIVPPPPAAAGAIPTKDKPKSGAAKGCLGCLGIIIGILVLLGIIGAIVGPSDSSKTDSSSGSTSSGWGSPQEKRLVGIYQSVQPPYVLQLSSGGRMKMQSLDSGDVTSGKWSIENGTLVVTWDSNGSETGFDINSDGSLNKQAKDYSPSLLFVKTQH